MSVRTRRTSWPAALVAVLVAALGSLWWVLGGVGLSRPEIGQLAVLAVAMVVTDPWGIRQPGSPSVPMSLAVVGAGAIKGVDPASLVAIVVAAHLVVSAINRRAPSRSALLVRVGAAWGLAGAAMLGSRAAVAEWGATPSAAGVSIGAASLVVVGLFVVPVIVESLPIGGRSPSRGPVHAIGFTWMVSSALAASTMFAALMRPSLGSWSIVVALLPLLAVRVGLERLAVAARAYEQTIRAMSRLPEQFGAVTEGHGVRVGALARQVADELGLDSEVATDVVRSAHLHELGRIELERDAVTGRDEVAAAGASVIREAGTLDRVARIVELHGSPASSPAALRVPVAIIVACCAIDRAGTGGEPNALSADAIGELVSDVGVPEVVHALSRVLASAPVEAS